MKEKKCSKCGELKELGAFNKNKALTDGLTSHCKSCAIIIAHKYRHTKKGLVTKIYGHQKDCSKKREMNLPSYSKQELTSWLFSQDLFHELYDDWKASGYKKAVVPSVNRLDDYKSYTLDNINLMTWQENKERGRNDRLNGVNNKASKAVLQFSIGGEFIKEYHSISQATRELRNRCNHICECCKGILNSSGGYKWQYKEAV